MAEQAPRREGGIPTEIERKFVIDPAVAASLGLEEYSQQRIAQGYLVATPDCAVRVRQKGEKFFLTYKAAPGEHAVERVELETELTADQFAVMWPGTEGRRVEKTRYEIPLEDGLTAELDVFDGDNAGHVLLEVEFPSVAEANAFEPPTWFGADVTQDAAYGNASIAEHGFPPPYLS